MFRKIRITSVALLITAALSAQTSGIKVHLIDRITKVPVAYAQVVAEQGDKQITGGMTDDKGYVELKPIDPGTYNVRAQEQGYNDLLITGVVVHQDILEHVEGSMVLQVDTSIHAVTISVHATDLIPPGTRTGHIFDSTDLHNGASNNINSLAGEVAGARTADVGGEINFRGARSDATQYIVDGQKITADQAIGSLPTGLVQQEQVITGGIPAKYGDVTGGIIEISTLSGADHYFGSVMGSTSNIFDKYNNNDVNWSVGGPIWTKIDSTKTKTTIVDFLFGGDYAYARDQNPSFIDPTYANSSTIAQLQANPLVPEPGGIGFYSAASFVTGDQMETQTWHQNDAKDEISLTGKLNFRVAPNVKITVGGSYQYLTDHEWSESFQMFDADQDPLNTQLNYKGFVRLTQNFRNPEGKDNKTSIIKNAFYTLQAEYSHTFQQTENGNFGTNFFDYGYVGRFYQYRVPVISSQLSNGKDGLGYYMTAFNDSAFTFNPSNLNPVEANYTKNVIQQLGTSGNYQSVLPANNGMINGSGAQMSNIYSLWYDVGEGYPSYSTLNSNHFRFSADFSAEIANNSIEVGFEYEQNSISQYSLSASELWLYMDRLANFQLTTLDVNNPTLAREGTYNAYTYNYLPNSAIQTQFDKSLRQKLGLPVNGNQWIQPDEYSPSMYSLNMFAATDLIQQGTNSLVYYSGYNYTGQLNSTNPSISDFFNDRDANGNLTYPVAAYRPIYMAGYIQDHFDIKTMVFDVGLRVEQFNANQYVLSDPYLLYPAYDAGSAPAKALAASEGGVPSDIGSNYVVYVNNSQGPSSIVGYRNGNNWYNSSGVLVADPTVISSLTTTGTIQPYLQNPSQTTLGANAFTTYTPQTEVLPRLAFSFPITDKADFFAHYDILSQRPPGIGYNILNPIEYMYIQSYIGQVLSNPALVPQQTVDYELGFTQVLDKAKSMALEISAFYRDMKDQVEVYRYTNAYPSTYLSYANIDFGTVKGVSVSYTLRRIGNWSDVKFRANYTLSFADGTGSGPSSGLNLASSGEPNLQVPSALSYDQRHVINANLDFHFSEGTSYDGPVWTTHSGHTVQVLSNAGINLNFTAASGTPYTQWINATQQGIGITSKYGIIGAINGDYMPWQNRVDVRVDKMFKVSIKSHPCQLTVFIAATNVLNTENVLNVYNYTGNPTDDGFLESAQGKQTIAGQISPQAYVSQYSVFEKNPTYFSMPRLASLGMTFNF